MDAEPGGSWTDLIVSAIAMALAEKGVEPIDGEWAGGVSPADMRELEVSLTSAAAAIAQVFSSSPENAERCVHAVGMHLLRMRAGEGGELSWTNAGSYKDEPGSGDPLSDWRDFFDRMDGEDEG